MVRHSAAQLSEDRQPSITMREQAGGAHNNNGSRICFIAKLHVRGRDRFGSKERAVSQNPRPGLDARGSTDDLASSRLAANVTTTL